MINWTVRRLRDGPKRYEYPRYLFSNESADIIGICADALDGIGVHWTLPRPNMLSVARRADVDSPSRRSKLRRTSNRSTSALSLRSIADADRGPKA